VMRFRLTSCARFAGADVHEPSQRNKDLDGRNKVRP
jgi:hypothetical protein